MTLQELIDNQPTGDRKYLIDVTGAARSERKKIPGIRLTSLPLSTRDALHELIAEGVVEIVEQVSPHGTGKMLQYVRLTDATIACLGV